jgi:hypothetical protein
VEPAAAESTRPDARPSVQPAVAHAADAPPAVVPRAGDVETVVRHVVAQYVSGLESRSVPALKRVWPSLGGSQERAIQAEFENSRSVRALFTDPQITVNGDTSTVTGFRTYNVLTLDGQLLSSLTKTTITLRRSGDGWVIERVVHRR